MLYMDSINQTIQSKFHDNLYAVDCIPLNMPYNYMKHKTPRNMPVGSREEVY